MSKERRQLGQQDKSPHFSHNPSVHVTPVSTSLTLTCRQVSTLTSPQKSQTHTQVVATNQRSSLNFFVYHPPYASNCSSAQLLYQSCWLINNSVWRVNVWWAELLWSSTNEWWPCRLAENDCFDRDKEADGTRTGDTDWHTPETCTLICFVQRGWSAQYMVGAHLHFFSIKMLLAIKMYSKTHSFGLFLTVKHNSLLLFTAFQKDVLQHCISLLAIIWTVYILFQSWLVN